MRLQRKLYKWVTTWDIHVSTTTISSMYICIPNMIKFHEVKCSEGLRFEPPMYFITSIAKSMGSYERASNLSIEIIDQEKKN